MSRLIPADPLRVGFTLIVIAALACSILVGGCGNSDTDTAVTPVSPGAQTPKLPASGPAISDKLAFDQLTLDSPAKRITEKNGLVYLTFAYTDNDGKVYKCKMPEAMAQGTYPPQEWLRTFTIYRLPEVIRQKHVAKKSGGGNINDFPFIAPRPANTAPEGTPSAAPQQQKPLNLPALPPLSSPSGTSTPPVPQPMERGT